MPTCLVTGCVILPTSALVTHQQSLRFGFFGSSQCDRWGALFSPGIQLSPPALWRMRLVSRVLKREEICWGGREREREQLMGDKGGTEGTDVAGEHTGFPAPWHAGKVYMEHPTDELTERVRLRGLTRLPGGWQGQDPLLWMVISVGYSSHLPLATS